MLIVPPWVYVDTGVTRPVELTVAMAVLDDSQGDVSAGLGVPVSWLVAKEPQSAKVPEITGNAFTLTL